MLYVAVTVILSNNPINRIDPDGLIDWKVIGEGSSTIAGGVISIFSGAGLTAGSGGAGAAFGMFLLVDGMAAVGIGTSLMILGFLTDPSEKNDKLLEEIPTSAINTASKIADISFGNENHEIEEYVDFLEFCYNLSTFNPSSIETGVEMIKTSAEAYGLYIHMWNLLKNEQEKKATEDNTTNSY